MSEKGPLWRRRPVVLTAVWVVVIAALLAGTRFYPTGQEPESSAVVNSDIVADPVVFAQEQYAATVVPTLESNAVELTELLPAIQEDTTAAGEEFGHRNGESPYSFPVRFTGTVVEGSFGEAGIEVEGLDPEVTVGMQTGPAVTGTAVRDAVGGITFEMFRNQIEFAAAATELNNQVKEAVLTVTDFEALQGSVVEVVGAFTYDNPSHIKVTPISIEVIDE